MTLALNSSTSIRPLCEEHLRMFRRTIGAAQENTAKVKIPVYPPGAKPILSDKKVTASEAEKLAESLGGRIASITEALMGDLPMPPNQPFFVRWAGWPVDEGWHHIDRRRRRIYLISEEDTIKLDAHERLFVNAACLKLGKEGKLMSIGWSSSRILLSTQGETVTFPVAIVTKKKSKSPKP